jgi:hypothetical protein
VKRTTCILIGLSLVATPAARADSVTLPAAKDNTLFSSGTASNGAGDSVFSGRTGASGGSTRQRAVFAFDLECSGIPAGSTVSSATFSLTLLSASAIHGGPEVHSLHRLLKDWGEGGSIGFGGVGAPAEPGDATWDHTFFPLQFWSTPGGDFDATVSASQVIGLDLPTLYTWGSTPEMIADVQGWLDDPGSNFGWILLGNEVNLHTAKRFGSRENAVVEFRPSLTVEFDPPPCGADLTGDSEVGINDLLDLLAAWGTPDADVTGDCDTNINDLLALLATWGPCP